MKWKCCKIIGFGADTLLPVFLIRHKSNIQGIVENLNTGNCFICDIRQHRCKQMMDAQNGALAQSLEKCKFIYGQPQYQ